MILEWLSPLLTWLGIGIVPFLLILIVLILIFKD